MARTYTQVRQLIAQQLGQPWPITGTADAGGSTTTLKDALLQLYNDDRLIGAHILLTSGTPSLTELLITDSAQSTGLATFRPALAAAPDALTYEILPYSAIDILRAMQDSVLELYDTGVLTRLFYSQMMTGSPIYNADWGYWTSTTEVDGWTLSNATQARERGSGNLADSETSVRHTTASGTLTLAARWRRYLYDMRGYTVTLYCPVLCDAASAARINLYAGSNNYSSYHSGTSTRWELLSVQVAIAKDAADIYPQLVKDTAASTVYWGMPFMLGGPVATTYPIPMPLMPDGPSAIYLSGVRPFRQDDLASGRGTLDLKQIRHRGTASQFNFLRHHDEDTTTLIGELDFSHKPHVQGQRMWLLADGPLTVPTTTTATNNIEVTYSESLLIALLAARKLLERDMERVPLDVRRSHQERISRLTRDFNEVSAGAGSARDVAPLPWTW